MNGMYIGKSYVSNRLFKLNIVIVKPKNNKTISFIYFLKFSNLWRGRLMLIIISYIN